jgi:outer membrane protein assembly factor BamB
MMGIRLAAGLGWGITWIVVLAAILGPAAVIRGDDWPQWLGPQRDDVWREKGILEQFPAAGATVRWRVPIGAGYSGPAVAQGRVYVMDRMLAEGAKNPPDGIPRVQPKAIAGSERVVCLNSADGKVVWKHEYDCPYTVSYPLGPRTTPLVKDGKVYTLGTEGNLFCLDADNGKPLWSHDFKKEYSAKTPLWGCAAHPLLDGQKLICMVGGEGTAVVAFDKDSGKELWKALTAKQIGYSPPMIYEAGGKRQLIIWHGEALNALDPETGQTYWSEPVSTYMAMAISTPRKFGDDLFITAYPQTAVLVRLGTEKPTAQVLWKGDRKKGLFSVFGTPFVEGGYIYGSTSNGALGCVKADTGERVWETLDHYKGQKAPSGDVFIVKNGDRFFLATEKGDLIIANLSPKGYEELGRTHMLDATSTAFGRQVVWSHPAFADRCIFMRNDKEILCASLAANK